MLSSDHPITLPCDDYQKSPRIFSLLIWNTKRHEDPHKEERHSLWRKSLHAQASRANMWILHAKPLSNAIVSTSPQYAIIWRRNFVSASCRSSIHEDYFPSMKALTAVTEKRLGWYLRVSSPPIYQQLTPSQVNRRPWKLSPATQYQDEIFLSGNRRTTVRTFCTFQENSVDLTRRLATTTKIKDHAPTGIASGLTKRRRFHVNSLTIFFRLLVARRPSQVRPKSEGFSTISSTSGNATHSNTVWRGIEKQHDGDRERTLTSSITASSSVAVKRLLLFFSFSNSSTL